MNSIFSRFNSLWRSSEGKIDWAKVVSQLLLPIMFLGLFISLSILSPVFLTWNNLFNITRQVAIIGILSLGQLLCLITGNFDLSIGVFLGLSGALLAGLSLIFGVPIAILLTLMITLIWGFTNGFLVTRGKGLSVIVTLSMMFVARGLTLIYTDGHPIINFPMPYSFLGSGNLGMVPWSLITFAVVSLIVGYILRFSKGGRHLYAIGGNRDAARICGIDDKRTIIKVYIATALCSFLSGIILLGRVASAQPTAGDGMEMDSMATVLIGGAAVSGGRGSVIGTLMGVFIVGMINNGLNLLGVSSFYQYVLKGLIILVAVVVDNLQRRQA